MRAIFQTSHVEPLRSRWIRLEFAQSFEGQPVRPLLRFHREGSTVEDHILPAAVLGKARWIGLAPADLARLEMLTLQDHTSEFRIEGLRPLSEFEVAWAVAKSHPTALARYLYSRTRGTKDRSVQLRSILDLAPAEHFERFRQGRVRTFEAEGLDAGLTRTSDDAPSLSLVMSLEPRNGTGSLQTLAALAEQYDPASTIVLIGTSRILEEWHGRLGQLGLVGRAQLTEIGPDDNPESAAIRVAGAVESDWVAHLRPGDTLAREAVLLLRNFVDRDRRLELVYSDSLARRSDGELRPRLKPDWSPAFLNELNYIGRPCLFRVSILNDTLQRVDTTVADPWWAAVRAAGVGRTRAEIGHLKRLLLEHVDEGEADARERSRPATAAIPRTTRSTIIIPTRDRVDLLQQAVTSILETLANREDYEILIVDNDSAEPRTLAYLSSVEGRSRVRVLRHPGPFNFPDLVNAGAQAATGDVLVLLNNDCKARDDRWLDALTSVARQADVGAVGAILLYEDGRLQHAGVALGLGGEAGHRDRKLPAAHPGNLRRLTAAHEVSAVTAACLAVERRKYLEIGGFDRAFAVAFNDIDFCLRLQERGYRTLLTPHAVLIHAESASRGQDTGPKRARFDREAALFRERWRPLIHDDPFFHPLFATTRFNDLLG